MEIVTKGFRLDLSRAAWQKSSRSGPSCDNCVEVAFVDQAIAVRDSKDPYGAVVVFTGDEWRAFTNAVRLGEFEGRH